MRAPYPPYDEGSIPFTRSNEKRRKSVFAAPQSKNCSTKGVQASFSGPRLGCRLRNKFYSFHLLYQQIFQEKAPRFCMPVHEKLARKATILP